MTDLLTIRTSNAGVLRPLLQSAMEREKKLLEMAIQHTRQSLAVFEARYAMSSAEFERQFKAREIEESLDTLDWWMEVEALNFLDEQHQSMSEAQID